MDRKFQFIALPGNKQITKPEALLFVDATGCYYAGERLTEPEVELLRITHKVSEIIWEGRQRYAHATRNV